MEGPAVVSLYTSFILILNGVILSPEPYASEDAHAYGVV